MNLLFILLLPFCGAAPPLLAGRQRNLCALTAALTPLLALAILLNQSAIIFNGELLAAQWQWLPALDLNFGLRLDALAYLFALLILGIGLLVILYARYYLAAQDSLAKLYALLLLFMGSMLGIVLADNLLLLLIFWELTGVVSFLLIGYWQQQSAARRGARMALTVTGAGGLSLLAGFLLLGQIVGSFDLNHVLAAGDKIRGDPLYPLALSFILLGAFTKSAQFPFHFWLPQAMTAPTPVSAYLHSATMVKAGVFLLARLYPALSGTDAWFYCVSSIGLITLLYGAYTALFQHDLKGLLAYSTISHLGLITLLFGLNSALAAVAAIFHIINHAIFKASLFMAAGVIDHETGTRDLRRINGLWRYLPHTGVLAMVAASAMAGVPLLNGFLSKEMFFSETLELQHSALFGVLVPLAAVIAGMFAVAYSLRFIHDVFFNGKPKNLPKFPPHEPPRYMKIPIEILVVLCLLVGTFPAFTVAPLLRAAATATLGATAPEYNLALWHGFNLPLLMSALAMVGGIAIYALRKPLFTLHDRAIDIDTSAIFENCIARCCSGAQRIIAYFDNGSLPRFIAVLLGLAALAQWRALLTLPTLAGTIATQPIDALTALGALTAVSAAIATVIWQRQRLLSLLAVGAVGLMVALAFARFSAPDLALTQIAVEIATLLLLLLALRFLPPLAAQEKFRGRDVLLAAAIGTGTGAFAFAIMTRPYDSIAQFFIDNSLTLGGGRNIVNVILVDFRGFDTFGEISVLMIAAIGVLALLDNFATTIYARAIVSEHHAPLFAVLARTLLPLALLVALHIFLRGHQLPGGGFVAGLITAVALTLQFTAHEKRWLHTRLQLPYLRIAVVGVLLASTTGIASGLFGFPFLTSSFGHLHLPLLGEIEFASALLFDLGVYATVVGVIMSILLPVSDIAAEPSS